MHPPGRLSAGPPAPGGPGPPPDQRPAAVSPLPHRPGPDASLHDARLQRPVSAEQLPDCPTDRLRHPSVPCPACLHQPSPHGPRPPGSPAPPRSHCLSSFWEKGLRPTLLWPPSVLPAASPARSVVPGLWPTREAPPSPEGLGRNGGPTGGEGKRGDPPVRGGGGFSILVS